MMANFDFTGDHIKDFIGLLEKIANGGSRSKVFNDFLTLAATAISNPADLDFTCNSKEVWQAREKLYIEMLYGIKQFTHGYMMNLVMSIFK